MPLVERRTNESVPPSGWGLEFGQRLEDGDAVALEIEGSGTLEYAVVERAATAGRLR
ncbi:hypothetical protein [Natrinema altunense]|uniref:Uncharacterized protein n=1 Tax=Natrinema altunense (strain JCM 12890 / CGMCC 1.3731 / AJ2) TaxID=1227494 RepID=L9ZDG9_NATA2|nr:hypothetical protein [Natrinema altunense]ELY84051.1 hypothetical protein C485_16420 [Natrinema altunense JCM 12890]